MGPRSQEMMYVMSKFRHVITSMALMAACCAHAAETSRNLINSNPFLPPNWKKPVKVVPSTNRKKPTPSLELRGIMKIRGERQFSLFDKRGNQRFWVKLNEKVNDSFQATKYDPETQTLTLLSGGRVIEVPPGPTTP